MDGLRTIYTGGQRLAGRVGPWVFAAVVGFVATYFLLGDIGYWADDYFFNNRDPATGVWHSLIKTTRHPYEQGPGHLSIWRPLHHLFTPALITLLWNHAWLLHLYGAVQHGVAALLFHRVLRRLGRSGHSAAAMAMLFLVWGGHYEPILWPSAYATGLASVLMLVVVLGGVAFAQGRLGWRGGLGVAALAACIPCFNEQPTGALIALLPFAIAARDERQSTLGVGRRMAPLLALMGISAAGYVLIIRAYAQPGLGTSAETLSSAWELPRRAVEVVGLSLEEIGMGRAIGPAARLGVETMGEHPWRTAGLAGAALLALPLALGRWIATPTFARLPVSGPAAPEGASTTLGRELWVCAGGLALFVGACLPLMATKDYAPNPRTIYVPLIGLLIVAAVASDAVGGWVHRRDLGARAHRFAGAMLVLGLIALGTMISVGMQARFARIDRQNQRDAASLRRLVPDPPAGTVFIPLADDSKSVGTRRDSFNFGVHRPWEWSFAHPYFILHVYRRTDLHAGFLRAGVPIAGRIDQAGYGILHRFNLPYEDSRPGSDTALIPWDRAVFFVVTRKGELRLVGRIVVRRTGQPDEAYAAPLVLEAALRGGFAPLTFEFEQAEPGRGPRPANNDGLLDR